MKVFNVLCCRGLPIVKFHSAMLAFILTAPCLSQTTCFTDPQGVTLCSGPEGVVRGTTNSSGYSVYRDDRGNRLDYEVDSLGRASIQLPSGESINWSQTVPSSREALPGNGFHGRPVQRPGPALPRLPAEQ